MSLSQWIKDGSCYVPSSDTLPAVEPGIYQPLRHWQGFQLYPLTPKTDAIISLGVAEHVFSEIQDFWKLKDEYKKLGFLHKRNFLLYGPPGTGKSITLKLISEAVMKQGGISLIIGGEANAVVVPSALEGIRQIHPNMPIVCCWEDIEQHCEGEDGDNFDPNTRSMMTSLLDGHQQVDNICHIGTTNHIENIDPAYRNRPGRFDEVIYVGSPERDVRLKYLKSIVPNGDPAIIEEIADKSDGLMLAHLKDTLVSSMIHKHKVEDVIRRLRETMKLDDQIKKDKEEKAARTKDAPSARSIGRAVAKSFFR